MQLAAGDLRPLAVRNLTRRRARPQIKQAPAAAMFVLDGNLESSLLLVDHLWEQTGPQLPGELTVGALRYPQRTPAASPGQPRRAALPHLDPARLRAALDGPLSVRSGHRVS